jgi:hypothetical protein
MNVIIGERVPIHLINFKLNYCLSSSNIVSINDDFNNNINKLIKYYINQHSERATSRNPIVFKEPEIFFKTDIFYNEYKFCEQSYLNSLRSIYTCNDQVISNILYEPAIYGNRKRKIQIGKHTLRDYKNNEFLVLGYVPRKLLRYFLLSYYLDPEPDLSVVRYLVKKDLKYKRSRFRDVYNKLIEDERNIELVESINSWDFAEGINLSFKTLEDLDGYLGEVSETFIEYLDRVIKRPVLTL